MEQIITLKVDLEYPEEAHHAINDNILKATDYIIDSDSDFRIRVAFSL